MAGQEAERIRLENLRLETTDRDNRAAARGNGRDDQAIGQGPPTMEDLTERANQMTERANHLQVGMTAITQQVPLALSAHQTQINTLHDMINKLTENLSMLPTHSSTPGWTPDPAMQQERKDEQQRKAIDRAVKYVDTMTKDNLFAWKDFILQITLATQNSGITTSAGRNQVLWYSLTRELQTLARDNGPLAHPMTEFQEFQKKVRECLSGPIDGELAREKFYRTSR